MDKRRERRVDTYGDEVAIAVGWAVMRLTHLSCYRQDGLPMITEIRIRLPERASGETMVVIKGLEGDVRRICFHSAIGPEQALRGAIERVANGQAGWKEDKFFVPLGGSVNTGS